MFSPLPLRRKLKLSDGQILPFSDSRTPSPVHTAPVHLTKRGWRFATCLVTLLCVAGVMLLRAISGQLRLELGVVQSHSSLPPLYEAYRSREENLPHYEEYARRTDIKYLWSENFARSAGWGNIMQDFMMMALLAHATNRSHVFNDYVWDPNRGPYSDFNGKVIPSRIPLTAIVGGPMVGGDLPPEDTTPRAVSSSFFHEVCPNPTIINVKDVNTDDMVYGDVPASSVLKTWIKKIDSIDDPCVKLAGDNPPIFEVWIYGDKKRMLTIWPYLSKTPVMTHWRWSPLVVDALKSNLRLFTSTSWFYPLVSDTQESDAPDMIPGLLAIHVRRGDFANHCRHLATWSSDWNAFNSFPQFTDKFEVPSDVGWGETTPENRAMYERRCYPSIDQIVEKVSQVRSDARGSLKYLYIMTNGAMEWVDELKQAVQRATSGSQPWDSIASSRDLKLTWEQKYVAQSVDMYIAERAQVLIGNGWSSLTSNVNALRMVKKFSPDSARFW
ncbi:hypothetical protein CONPUDRAFT_126793 [Coniophora puteana RWD-64-598 SS2]|uniref:Uncharacterized protein n=1 Tax=Coniophora puteana (strain RWD-64-598) TaxID=741705 RepID=A0A5M3MKF4_CONPW|nr:uncharacterized protein CONPUDRAFT_126793 [Coniophora puteana RWD-64-598 SS2]EIW79021.1 hypothetical protein CONPUDRAFT_126793 [Coniophora puteana RWD-64-598 SS2]